jgi:GT2 family glycosyltransferase
MRVAISVLIVTYNSAETIEDCLTSLNRQTFRDFEVILVDNGSKDDTVKTIEFLGPRLTYPFKLVPLGENKGFAGGNNHALRFAKGQYIALLNPDAAADDNWLAELWRAMNAHPEAGIGASKVTVAGSEILDSAGLGMASVLKSFNRGEGEDSGQYCSLEYVFGACGAAAVYRKTLIDNLGFFDEDFFLLHEDVDLSFRAQLSNWKVLYVPSARLQHEVSASIKKMSDMQVYFTTRNSELVRVKNVPLSVFIRCFPAYLAYEFAEFFYFAVRHRRLGLYFKAKLDVLRLLPKMLQKRKEIMQKKRVGDSYISSLMTSIWQRSYFRCKIRKLFFR